MVFSLQITAQNLVTNPDFEQFRTCPGKANDKLKAKYQLIPRWYTVSAASPDYFNSCSKSKKVGVPVNFAGEMEPHSGNGYIGLILKANHNYYKGSPLYTEHITNRLKKPLKKDEYYCFEMWICLGKNSYIAAKDFGVYFSKSALEFNNPPDTLPTPHIKYVTEKFIDNKTEWIALRGIYKAQGGERYMTIGNFQPWLKGRFIPYRSLRGKEILYEYAYYLIDDVSLTPIADTTMCDCNMITVPLPVVEEVVEEVVDTVQTETSIYENAEVGEAIILKNIFFAFDKSDLLPESYKELNKIVALMNKYPTWVIEINGHTDFVGSASYNQKLSEDRAGSVVDYLISQGISADRLQFNGYGKTQPIADNSTDEGRQMNRRVEFIIVSK